MCSPRSEGPSETALTGEIGIVDGRNGHGDEIGALRTKISRRAVEDVTKIPGDAQHRVAAVLARRAIALESGRYRHQRHARLLGHICHGWRFARVMHGAMPSLPANTSGLTGDCKWVRQTCGKYVCGIE